MQQICYTASATNSTLLCKAGYGLIAKIAPAELLPLQVDVLAQNKHYLLLKSIG